jgi:hypothetical protein
MDNNVSGSVIEPRIVPNQIGMNNKKTNAIHYIAIIVEAIIIVGLAVALVFVSKNQDTDGGYADDGDNYYYQDDEGGYILEDDDAYVLRYTHAVANNNVFQQYIYPESFCDVLKKVYNNLPNGDTFVDSPCRDGKIVLFSIDKVDADLTARGVSHFGVVLGDQSYNYYIYSDFSGIEYLSEDNTIPTTTITLNVGS